MNDKKDYCKLLKEEIKKLNEKGYHFWYFGDPIKCLEPEKVKEK